MNFSLKYARLLKGSLLIFLGFLVCSVVSCAQTWQKIDYRYAFDRRGWNHTDKVIETLDLKSSDVVTDLGAGSGYFSFYLSEEVNDGLVYAVDVDAKLMEKLSEKSKNKKIDNILTIVAETDDPNLPNGKVDLVFLCNSYHHLENRIDYFKKIKPSLRENARVAILDTREGTPFFIIPHGVYPDEIRSEMQAAGYTHVASYDFLPFNSFQIFRLDIKNEAHTGAN